ncbi:putative major pilin subunit [Pirellulimonas nuda]|uniref:Putative major pilin subunit n=1 Tax=Pirellulimonas nuda TaxID=2528009 RepID=A0A518DIZ4_9BACT|nr:putative major pilin subunit [Pirellulimonas nuda]
MIPSAHRQLHERPHRLTRGFTLVELLVVIAIIGILVALLLPAVQAAREAARRSSCINNLRQVGLASLNYEGARGHFPPAVDWLNPNRTPPMRRDHSWIVFILPYMEEQALYDSIDDTVEWYDPKNEAPATTPLPGMRCPSRSELDPVSLYGPGNNASEGFGERETSDLNTHYLAVLGANTQLSAGIPFFCSDNTSPYTMEAKLTGTSRVTKLECIEGTGGPIANSGVMFRFSKTKMSQVVDGTTSTFLAGEAAFGEAEFQRTRPWIAGAVDKSMYGAKNLAYAVNSGARPGPARNDMGFGSEHPGGCHFTMTDGSTSFFNENIELIVLFNLAARNDGNLIDSSQR